MTVSTHKYACQLTSTVRTIDVPAHDVQHPATSMYGTGFEDGTLDTWAATAGSITLDPTPSAFYAHTGYRYAFLGNASGTARVARTVTGLTPGVAYQFGTWASSNDGSYDHTVTLGVTGIGSSTGTLPKQANLSTPWTFLGYSFTATAASHELYISTPPYNTASSQQAAVKLDDLAVIRPAWIEHVADHYADPQTYTLDVVDGTVTLDEGVQPYMTVGVTISRPAAAVLAQMDPANSPRVILTATETNTGLPNHSRTFNGLLRSRAIDHEDDTVAVTFVSDDVLMQDDKLIATASNASNLTRQSSVRSICAFMVNHAAGAALAAGTSDADFTTLRADTNYVTNGSFEANTTGWTASACSIATSTNWSAIGAQSMSQVPNATSGGDSYSSLSLSLTAGNTYTASGTIRLQSVMTGTLNARARTIQIIATVGGTASIIAASSAAPNTANTPTRLSVTFAVPAGATAVSMRLYNGAQTSGGNTFWDAVMVVDGDGTETDTVTPMAYFDGDTPATANYGYAYTGGARVSASTRTPVFERPVDNLIWQPGDSAWDFLEPILDAVGLRLFCDETRAWQLVDNNYSPAGLVTLAAGFNLYEATDSTDRDATAVDGSPLYIDSALVKYTWTDRNGNTQVRYDAYSLPNAKSSYMFQVSRPYPGPGAAKYAVTRNNGRGHALDIAARHDWSVTPSQQVAATLPETDAQVGYVSSVAWDIGSDDMAVFTRGLIQTPPTAWFYEAAGLSWAALPAGSSWANG